MDVSQDASGAGAAAPVNWMLRTIMLTCGVVVTLCYSLVAPVLPAIAAALAHDAKDAYLVKLIMGVIGAATVVGAPAAGFLIDRFGRRGVITWAALIYAAAGCAPLMLNDLSSILVTRFVMGAAGAAIVTTGVAMISDYFGESGRNQWIGFSVAFATLSGLVGTPLAGFLGDVSWRAPFALYAVGLPMAALAWFGFRGAARPAASTAAAKTARGKAPVPLGLMLIGLLVGVIIYVPNIYIPFRLRELGAASASQIAILLTIESIIGAALCFAYGRVRQRVSMTSVFCFCFGSIAAGMTLIGLSSSQPVVITGLILRGLGMGWLGPNILAMASAAADGPHRGRILGLVKGALAGASLVGVSLFEPISEAYGSAGGILAVATVAAVMLGWAILRSLRPGARTAAETA